MNHITRLILGGASAFFLGGSAFAQSSDNVDKRFYIAPYAVWQSPDGDRTTSSQVDPGIAIGKTLGRGTNLELSYERMEPEIDPTNGDLLQEFYGLGVQLFPMRDRLPFYILVRGGRGVYTREGNSGDNKAESDQFNIGVGYLQPLGSWPLVGRGPALRMDVRYQYDKFSNGEAQAYAALSELDSADRSFHDVMVSLGLQIPLGADPNAPVPTEEPEPDEVIIVAATDSDGDSIPDTMDECPNTPDGARIDAQGCEVDSDGDGVADSKDQCPGTFAGLSVDARGCAPDGDQDGVLDVNDQCPSTPSGAPVLADGCAPSDDCRLPQPGQSVDARGCVAVDTVILEGVTFATNSADLGPQTRRQLDEVAAVLRGSRGVRFEVAGHTDDIGGRDENRALSENRAIAVKNYLVTQDVPASRLSARGYGESQPLAPNTSAANRARNRRVELRALTD